MKRRSARQRLLDRLDTDGYRAAVEGKPCDAPTPKELERAAWEIGWRAGKKELELQARGIKLREPA